MPDLSVARIGTRAHVWTRMYVSCTYVPMGVTYTYSRECTADARGGARLK